MEKTIKLKDFIRGLKSKEHKEETLEKFSAEEKQLGVFEKEEFVDMFLKVYLSEDENGFTRKRIAAYDYVMFFVFLEKFSNIDLLEGNDISLSFEDYEEMRSSKKISKSFQEIRNSNYLSDIVEIYVDQEMSIRNSLEYTISKKIDTLMNKLPSMEEILKIVKEVPALESALKGIVNKDILLASKD